MATPVSRIKRSTLNELLEQNRAMRALLEQWPARSVMMEWEKEWNEQRESLLSTVGAADLSAEGS